MGAAPHGDSVGRYELLIELAKGGMAELYVGRLHGIGGFAKLVAIKRILPHLAEDKLFAEMFLNEGRIAAQLAHANICQVHELGEADGDLFLAMEYLEGVTWSELAKKLPRDTNTLRLAAGVIAQACDGLHFAHELRDLDGNPTPVVHRDVSPQNLFVTTDGTCKVLDFGIAKMLKDGPRTRTGVLKGKLPYMSPEQIQGEEIDARSDVFALGVVLWEALTGRSLFDRETDFLIWKAITEAPIPPLAQFGYPASIDAVIGSALARDKKLRFRSARALGEALRNAVEPIGGACDAGEIADIVRLHCGGRLALRQREIASAVTRRSQPTLGEPNAADTIEDKAAATADLAPVKTNAGSTVRLRSDAKAVSRTPDAREPEPDATIPPTRKRDEPVSGAPSSPHRSKAPWIIAGGLVIAAVIVAIAVTRSPDAPSAPSTTAPVATREDDGSDPPATETDTDDITTAAARIEEAGKTLEAASRDGRIGKAWDKLESLSKWGQHMGDSVYGTGSAAKHDGSTDNESTTPEESAEPGETQPTSGKKKPTKTPDSRPQPATSKAAGSDRVMGEGFVTVDSDPFATIYLDGTNIGPTMIVKRKIAAGKHTVRAVLEDGREKTLDVVIEDGKVMNLGKLRWP